MRIRLTILITFVTSWISYAQTPDLKNYKIEGSNIVLHLNRNMAREDQEKLLEKTGMVGLSLDTLWRFGSLGQWVRDGWKIAKTSAGYKIYKSINDLSGDLKGNKAVINYKSDLAATIRDQVEATFGFNSGRNTSVVTTKTGTRFFLKDFRTAKDVYLSGTFNEWSTLKTRMIKVDSGWVTTLPLQPGKHQYKFIVDGHWMEDPKNDKREADRQGGMNSVYFVPNYEFKLAGNLNARKVILAGSFNNWDESELRMQKKSTGWNLPVYLKDGTYEYKFIVDGNWITDPGNPARDDGKGNTNSYISMGKAFMFKLNGYPNAKKIILAGEFNNWNEEQLVMKKNQDGWELPIVLAPGNYQYKFIIDGQWITDPGNPHLASLDGHINSVIAVKPNYTFKLKRYPNAVSVAVAGSFNDWGIGYSMKKTADGWIFEAYLPPGKWLYKFVVDGKWIIDPDNEQWEQNEFHNGNSVLWIGPGEE